MQKKENITFRIHPRRRERLGKAAQAEEKSMTAFLEEAIDEKIARDGPGLREIEDRGQE
jgi:uncharacterized protein (DUF1778 family)